MDPEQTYLRVHARISGMLSQLLTPRIRLAIEYVYLTVAVALFCLLVVMHTNFVQQPACSIELSGIKETEAQLFQIKIVSTGLWPQNADQNMVDYQNQGSLAESSIIPDVSADGDIKDDIEVPHKQPPMSPIESLTAAVIPFCRGWQLYLSSFWRSTLLYSSQLWNTAGWNPFLNISASLKMLRVIHVDSLIVQWLDKRSKSFEPTYLYTVEKGFFLLPEEAKARHNVRTVNITISAQNACFGNRWQQLLINGFVGYETILMNSLLSSPGHGYLYNFQTKEFYDLSYGHESSEGPARFGDYFVTKCSVLMMSLFVFFTTTMSVSFTLRETQSRMLKFTVQLQHHARHQLPTFRLIFVHVIESLVFVPIMIGMLFFLFEFYDDQLLAFLMLILVWLSELFTMISMRTSISMQFFPRFFLLYFLVFHIYFFSYAYGFSYLAFSATAAFVQHLILYFWNRFEVPALHRFIRSRGQLLQQAGVQITSSTIYTSTLHIARVNVRNTDVVNNDLRTEPELLPAPGRVNDDARTQEQLASINTDSVSNPRQFPDLRSQQNETAQGSGSLNPFGSFLLWILGGAPSEGSIFYSMFRDVREGGQEEPANPENEPMRLH